MEYLPEQLIAGNEKQFLNFWFLSKKAQSPPITDLELDAYYREYSKPNRMTQGWAYYRAIPQTAEAHRRFAERKLEMPVLAIGGSHSAGRKLEQALIGSTPHAVGDVIADCGHFVPEEQPERTAAVIFDRLQAAGL